MTGFITQAEPLSVREFIEEAEPRFLRVFKTFDLRNAYRTDEIFQAPFESGVVLECGSFPLLPAQFEALRKAARSVGDEFMYLTILYTGLPDDQTWRLPLLNYEQYYSAGRQSRDGIPLERALYSPMGHWGVVSYDPFSIVCGSDEFLRVFKRVYPEWSTDLAEFVQDMREAKSLRGLDVSWVQSLLDSLYGDDAPRFELGQETNGVH
jgi:hypothetical protein